VARGLPADVDAPAAVGHLVQQDAARLRHVDGLHQQEVVV
jgi:hypothetical protein